MRTRGRSFQPGFHDLERRMLPATFLVNTTADSGAGSLRQAILDSNGNTAGTNTIDFGIGTTGSQQTITPLSVLPVVTNPVLLDGYSQGGSGYAVAPLVMIDGINVDSGDFGLWLATGSDGSTVSGLAVGDCAGGAIVLSSSHDAVEGCYVGLKPDGTTAAPNLFGVDIYTGSNDTIGGTTPGSGNVISGNASMGMEIQGGGSGNLVVGNFIGTDPTGKTAIPNQVYGIDISEDTATTIGGTTPAARNVISGNTVNGINDSQVSVAAAGTVIEGNYIGVDVTGNVALPNVSEGIEVGGIDAVGVLVGGSSPGAGNVISGNGNTGLEFEHSASDDAAQGNLIGLGADGETAIPNSVAGVYVDASASAITIGGVAAGTGNVISSNPSVDIWLDGVSNNLVEGNKIGTDAAGATVPGPTQFGVYLYNAPGTTIGGTIPAAMNVIGGATQYGVVLDGSSTTGDAIEGNEIGTNTAGTASLGNKLAGVYIYDGATGNTIGGASAGAGNLISGNNAGTAAGIEISGAGTSNNLVEGNTIGLSSGGAALGNTLGVEVDSGASGTTIGGTAAADRNVIAGNAGPGVELSSSGNLVAGNYLGVNASGTTARPNSYGVRADAAGNTIGGLTTTPGTGAGNVIAGNTAEGILFYNVGSAASTIEGNLIGLGSDGVTALGNALYGIYLALNSPNVTIGGTDPRARNVISSNTGYGILTDSGATGLVVQGNEIGTDLSGTLARANTYIGVGVLAANAVIGGLTTTPGTAPGNLISGNGSASGGGLLVGGGARSSRAT